MILRINLVWGQLLIKELFSSTTLGSISLQPIKRLVTTPSYKVTKAALNMLTVIYAHELEHEGFTVFCISPGVGFMETLRTNFR